MVVPLVMGKSFSITSVTRFSRSTSSFYFYFLLFIFIFFYRFIYIIQQDDKSDTFRDMVSHTAECHQQRHKVRRRPSNSGGVQDNGHPIDTS